MSKFVTILAVLAVSVSAKPPQQIVGGNRAYYGAFPYLVSISVRHNHLCGGAIIDDRHIVTAAHCFVDLPKADRNEIRVRTGSLSRSFGGRVYDVVKIISHENYRKDAASTPYDIAILKTATPIKFDSVTRKVELATAPTSSGDQAVAAGWEMLNAENTDLPNQLLTVNLKTLSSADCRYWFNDLYDSQVCLSAPTGKGLCMGDSGGPIVSKGKLIGVVSFGVPCGIGFPDVLTSVYHYKDWIQKNRD